MTSAYANDNHFLLSNSNNRGFNRATYRLYFVCWIALRTISSLQFHWETGCCIKSYKELVELPSREVHDFISSSLSGLRDKFGPGQKFEIPSNRKLHTICTCFRIWLISAANAFKGKLCLPDIRMATCYLAVRYYVPKFYYTEGSILLLVVWGWMKINLMSIWSNNLNKMCDLKRQMRWGVDWTDLEDYNENLLFQSNKPIG